MEIYDNQFLFPDHTCNSCGGHVYPMSINSFGSVAEQGSFSITNSTIFESMLGNKDGDKN